MVCLSKVAPGGQDTIWVRITKKGGTAFHDLNPLGLGPQNDAWLLEKERFFLHLARTGYNKPGLLLQLGHVQ